MDLVKISESFFSAKFTLDDQWKIFEDVEAQFGIVVEKHKHRPAKWYNDDGRYRSAVIEMLSMKENAMSVPKLSAATYDEWNSKQKYLRQASRMVSKEKSRYILSCEACSRPFL